jgi:hypothetical protein
MCVTDELEVLAKNMGGGRIGQGNWCTRLCLTDPAYGLSLAAVSSVPLTGEVDILRDALLSGSLLVC